MASRATVRRRVQELKKRNPLTVAVLRQAGLTLAEHEGLDGQLRDVAKGGADAGWHGFTYYTETTAFAERHYKAIMAAVIEFERETGQPFGETTKNRNGEYGTYRAADETEALNWLAWFALESVAYDYERICEEEGEA